MVQHRLKKHDCRVHTSDVVERLGLLLPGIPEEGRPVRPAELADWITVEAEDDPEIVGHRWRVELDDGVGLLIRPDHDDLADLLGEQAGVHSVVQLDREVIAVDAPRLCADGLRAAVMAAVAAANRRAHDPHTAGSAGTQGGDAVAPSRQVPATHVTQPVEPPEDDNLCRLVSGDAVTGGRKVQVWVNMNGILILPAGTIPHGPLDFGENPRFQRATVTPTRAVSLAKGHAGRWIPYSSLGKVRLRRPGLVRRRWTATVVDQDGDSVPLSWRGARPNALLLWGYVVARRGLGAVDGLP
ncbi:hypothetical protein Asphe3_21310 [Pseudarthrobacter phenanthrenivorans Sphe3]|uniref:Uncharacterized protein n=1 Tax=Pseudarthrobacter phenanthrenivorans (strain DSM 18606 / JCM 16027 / LMG 23796 / Sphe3) TaxID=930171 RepID=F0M363_PSEPM|nr:hypothetical protein [Pseudarthrobacter phenanthrenivorans]ADX73284.1 hypothetical protein Asphe3_21310 [Pseudarthrobacter phenanthrenivorans Sphe3]